MPQRQKRTRGVVIPLAGGVLFLAGLAQIPHATATTRICLRVGSAFGTTVLAMLPQTQLAHHPGLTAFNHTFWWSVALAAVAAVPALALPRSGRATARSGSPAQLATTARRLQSAGPFP